MTLVTIGHPIVWPAPFSNEGNSHALADWAVIDAAGEYAAFFGVATEAMTISHVGYLIGTATGSPDADIRIESVDTAGSASGNLWATNTNGASGTLSANTWHLTAMTASASIAAGQVYCIKILYNSGTAFRPRISSSSSPAGLGVSLPYRAQFLGGAETRTPMTGSVVALALGSGATTFYKVPGAFPFSTVTTTTFSNATGDRRGVRFQVPFACRCSGLLIHKGNDVDDYSVAIYNDAGTELSSSSTAYDGDHSAVSTAANHFAMFDSPVTLSPSTWYRAAVIAGGTSTKLDYFTMPSADYMSGMPGGANYYLTTYTTAGGWVDSATSSVPGLSLVIDKLSDTAGVPPGHGNMSGGLFQ